MCWRLELVVELERSVIGREMNLTKRRRSWYELVAGKHFFRNYLFDLREVNAFEHVMHNRTKLLRSHLAELAINRNPSARMNRIRVIIQGEFIIGILNLVKPSAAALPLTV